MENRIYTNEFIGEKNMQTINNATTTIKEIWSYQHPVMHNMVFIQCCIYRLHVYTSIFRILNTIRYRNIFIQNPEIKQELRIKVLVFVHNKMFSQFKKHNRTQ